MPTCYRNLLLLLVLSVSVVPLWAQTGGLILSPLDGNRVVAQAQATQPTQAKSPLAALTLPFFDDFSYAGPFPDANLWADKTTFVNSTMSGANVPSVGVATFDALDAKGTPYSDNPRNLTVGSADTLTANPIALDAYTAADSLILSFYLQPKGLNYSPAPIRSNTNPPTPADSLILEFRNVSGTWVMIRQVTIPTIIPFDSIPKFVYYNFKITDPQYLYGQFQFRLRNYTRLNGTYGAWHLDYVRLDRNRRYNDEAFADIAFTQRPKSALKNYSALPWRQVKAALQAEIRDSITLALRSNFGQLNNITDSRASIKDVSNGNNLFAPFVILTENIPASTYIFRNVPLADRAGYFSSLSSQAFQDRESVVLETQYSFRDAGQAPEANLPAARRNDTVSLQTNMTNYFAYDDGTAEFKISPQPGPNNAMAMRFRANVADTLRGVQLFFPHILNNSTTTTFNLKIWKDSLVNTTVSRPIFTMRNVRPYYADARFDTLQGYTTYRLEDSAHHATFLPITAGNFFVGIELNQAVEVPIGLDRNTLEATSKLYYVNATGTWVNDQVNFGAPMIRPMTGKFVNNTDPTATTEIKTAQRWQLYPNPTTDVLRLETLDNTDEAQTVLIFNTLGQTVQTQIISGAQATLDVSTLPAGAYFLQIRTKNTQGIVFSRTFVKN